VSPREQRTQETLARRVAIEYGLQRAEIGPVIYNVIALGMPEASVLGRSHKSEEPNRTLT
jgi:hypothetical protein